MSIHTSGGQDGSLTETRRALRHFTNRVGSIKSLARYLNDDPAQEKILFFHGDGGNGKTLLLRFLRESCCKRLESVNWDYVSNFEGAEFSDNFVEAIGCVEVPSTLVDFALEPRGEYRPKEAFSALAKMRRDLAGTGLRFPLYDFACALYLHKTGRLTPERLTELFPQEEIDFIKEAVDIITELPGAGLAKAALGLFNKRLSGKFTLYQKSRQLEEEQVEELRAMDPESDLYAMFPTLFGRDLSAAMTMPGAPERVVLFFDTHEAFWEVAERRFSDEKYFLGDEWLRRLLNAIQLSNGIVAVVAGREAPRWAEATRETILAERIEKHLLGGLSAADAGSFLGKVGIDDPEMRGSLLAYSEVRPDEIHPLFLGLCADIVLAASDSGKEISPEEFRDVPGLALKARELMNRLRKYIDRSTEYAISALSACRSFDRDLYVRLMKGLDLSFSRESFGYLTEFSIVWQSIDSRQGWYRIHDLIRRLAAEQKDATTIEAHRFLSDYYQELGAQGNVVAIAEAAYHLNRLDASAGVRQWSEAMDQALARAQYDVCRTLLGIRNELFITDNFDRALVSTVEGDYYAALSVHANAEIEYREAIACYEKEFPGSVDASSDSDLAEHCNNKAITLVRLGEVQAALWRHEEAINSYQQAILACDASLRLAPEYAFAFGTKGLTLMRLGEMHAALSRHEEAVKIYHQGIIACDAALRITPDLVMALSNKGGILMRLGEVQAILSHHQEAIKSYQQAILACDAALQLDPELVLTISNKGIALMRVGEVQAMLSQHEEAIESYHQAIRSFDAALQLAPELTLTLNNKGVTLTRLGELQATLARQEDAIKSFEEAIRVCDATLRLAPDHAMALSNKGGALMRLGEMQAGISHHEEAIKSYQQAIVASDAALRLGPDLVLAHNNRSLALTRTGDALTELSRPEEAAKSYRQAIIACDVALQLAPDMTIAHSNKGLALIRLGELQANLSQAPEAMKSYQEAILTFDAALRLAPDLTIVHGNRGLGFLGLGEVQATLSLVAEAVKSYEQAILACDAALQLAPDLVMALSNKANALVRLGDAQATLAQSEEAMESYQQAILASDAALRLAPDLVMAHNSKGTSLLGLSEVQTTLSPEKAGATCERAILAFDAALQLAPGLVPAHNNRGLASLQLAVTLESTAPERATEALKQALAAFSRSLEIAPSQESIRELRDQIAEELSN